MVRVTNKIIIVIIVIKNLQVLSGHPSTVELQKVTIISTVQGIRTLLG